MLISFATHMRLLCDEFNRTYGVFSIASRLSGDEFAILIGGPQRLNDCASEFSQRLLDPIRNNDNTSLSNFPITASVGIATFMVDGDHIDKLLIHADAAMYQAKIPVKTKLHFILKNWMKKSNAVIVLNVLYEREILMTSFHWLINLTFLAPTAKWLVSRCYYAGTRLFLVKYPL